MSHPNIKEFHLVYFHGLNSETNDTSFESLSHGNHKLIWTPYFFEKIENAIFKKYIHNSFQGHRCKNYFILEGLFLVS